MNSNSNPSWLTEVAILRDVLSQLLSSEDSLPGTVQPRCPVVSFEGICGTGKSTQLERCRQELQLKGLLVETLELPNYDTTDVSALMKVLYKDKAGFAFVEEHLPWLNPAFISVDCLESLRRVDETTDVLLFSRGLLSTYVYNLPPLERNLGSRDSAFRLLDRLLTTMPTPDLVLYFDIPVDEAYRRVLKRSGTEPLRGRETLRGLAETHDLFEWILSQRRLRDLNMVRVDAALPEHDLTQTLIDHLVALLNERAGLRKSKG